MERGKDTAGEARVAISAAELMHVAEAKLPGDFGACLQCT